MQCSQQSFSSELKVLFRIHLIILLSKNTEKGESPNSHAYTYNVMDKQESEEE